MNKLKDKISKINLNDPKTKKVLIAIVIIFVLFLILSNIKKNNGFGGFAQKNKEVDKTIQAEYEGSKKDDGLRNAEFQTEEISYIDSDYGELKITIRGQFYYRENHDKSYYLNHPYNKKEINGKIRPLVINAITEILRDTPNIKYNNIRETLSNKVIVSKIKDEVDKLDFSMERVDIVDFPLTRESIQKINEIEAAKRPVLVPEENPYKKPETPIEDIENNEETNNNTEN